MFSVAVFSWFIVLSESSREAAKAECDEAQGR